MKILYVASEANPYAASGGLGDVMGALPASVKKYADDGSDVSVILPLYGTVAEEYRAKMKKVKEFYFYLSWRHAYCGIYLLRANGVNYYFVDNEYYFKRGAMYGDFDDGERFAFFSGAVIEFMLNCDYIPDILHANDWQSALSVIYLKTKYSANPTLSGIKTVFTIHNIEYQGKYGLNIIGDVLGLDNSYRDIVEFDGNVNLLKGAIVCADKVTTVSPNYAKELESDFFAFGLHNIVKMYGDKFTGIINGIDVKYFSPSNAEDITKTYTVTKVKEGKRDNKLALQKKLGLPEDENIPLVAMITRLTAGKGIDLVLCVLDELLSENMQFVILGTGDSDYERIMSDICLRHPDKARAIIKFDRKISKEIYSSADIFLMPSKSEPCGLAQMVSCRYGTIPIVRGVGGLYDSIIPYGSENSNGFVFQNFNAHEMLFKIKEALALYENKPEWSALVKRAMKSDFTWDTSAGKYIEIYKELIG